MTVTGEPSVDLATEVTRALELIGLGTDGLVHGCGCGHPHPPARSALDTDPGRWRRIRVAILKRDGYACRAPVPGGECGGRASVAGHVLARRLGGCDDPANLRAECRTCSSSDGATLGNDERAALELARLIVARSVAQRDGAGSSGGSSDLDPAMKLLSLSKIVPANVQVRGSGSSSPDSLLEVDGSTLTVPGPDDPVWDDAPWLDELREVPPEAVWPRLMTYPHPRAVGTYGDELVAVFTTVHRRQPRWWQRLAFARIGEHDEAGHLVWTEYLGTLSRQGGKSWALRTLALWRVLKCAERWDEQLVVHTGRDVAIVREVLKRAQSWGERNGLHVSRNNLEPGLSTEPHMSGSRWIIRAKDATYGYSPGAALVDEVWDVPAGAVEDGIEPSMVEQTSPQLGLWSTAHRKATGLGKERRQAAIEQIRAPITRLLLEWSTPSTYDRGDRAGWRLASPHWSPAREAMIAKAYDKVRRGVSLDPEEPDPIASFDAQWLNRWPAPASITLKSTDEPLLIDLERVDGEPRSAQWQAALDPQVMPAPGAPLFLAVEDELGSGSAAAAAGMTRDGRIVVGGWRFGTRQEAIDWCQDVGEDAADPLLLVGASFADDPELEGLEVPVEPAGAAESRTGLPMLRELVRLGRIAHDGGRDTSQAMLTARVRIGVDGAAMLLRGDESTALVRCLSWVAQRAWRERA